MCLHHHPLLHAIGPFLHPHGWCHRFWVLMLFLHLPTAAPGRSEIPRGESVVAHHRSSGFRPSPWWFVFFHQVSTTIDVGECRHGPPPSSPSQWSSLQKLHRVGPSNCHGFHPVFGAPDTVPSQSSWASPLKPIDPIVHPALGPTLTPSGRQCPPQGELPWGLNAPVAPLAIELEETPTSSSRPGHLSRPARTLVSGTMAQQRVVALIPLLARSLHQHQTWLSCQNRFRPSYRWFCKTVGTLLTTLLTSWRPVALGEIQRGNTAAAQLLRYQCKSITIQTQESQSLMNTAVLVTP